MKTTPRKPMKLHLYLMSFALAMVMWSCANLGDGKFNPEFSDTFGNGQIDAFGLSVPYVELLQDAAVIASLNKPGTALKIIEYFESARDEVAGIQGKYDGQNATALIRHEVMKQCGVYCNLMTTQRVLNTYFTAIDTRVGALEGDDLAPLTDWLNAMIDALSEATRNATLPEASVSHHDHWPDGDSKQPPVTEHG